MSLLRTVIIILSLSFLNPAHSQKTRIMGFMDVGGKYQPNSGDFAFVIGESDLFIQSDITDKISYLGETVFKYSANSPTKFNVAIERAIVKYNYFGNHNVSIGRYHTPVNYWNDSYHHGRVFFPTIGRPEMFNKKIVPIHNLGIRFQAANLGKLKFGYDVLVGNGIGSNAISDNDKHKSYTFAAHIKPWDGIRFGLSSYFDKITAGSTSTGETVSHSMYTASFACFKKFEFLGEYSFSQNATFSISAQNTHSLYLYAGYRIKDSYVPYIRVDYLGFDDQEMYYTDNKLNGYTIGFRYEMNYMSALKFEYTLTKIEGTAQMNQQFNVQLAVGFNYYEK